MIQSSRRLVAVDTMIDGFWFCCNFVVVGSWFCLSRKDHDDPLFYDMIAYQKYIAMLQSIFTNYYVPCIELVGCDICLPW